MRARISDSKALNTILVSVNVIAGTGLLIALLSPFINPHFSSIPAFFGLSFLIWFWLVFVLTCLMLILRTYWWILLSSLFCLSIPEFLDHYRYQGESYADSSKDNPIHLVSYNVRLFDLYNWSENSQTRNKIFDQLSGMNADIYCFQEFYQRDIPGFFDTRDTMITFLRANQVHERYTHHLKTQQHFGLATFSAFPIINKGEINFGNDPNNHCIYSDVVVRGRDTIRVYNAHFSSIRFQNGDGVVDALGRLKNAYLKRSDQVVRVLNHAKESPYPTLVCGDFNDTPTSYAYRLFSSSFKDAFVESGRGYGSTYASSTYPLRIDYIFHSDDVYTYGFKVHQEQLSDHHAISCFAQF